jgi:hypothetical protein
MESYAPSAMPRWLTVPVGILAAVLLAPFFAMMALLIFIAVPAAVPFIFVAFVGDFKAEQEAYEESVEKFREWKLPPLWEPDHLAPQH